MRKIIRRTVLKYGDNINTDIISPPQYMELSVEEAAKYAMSAVTPDFSARVNPGDIIVAGANFGSGSSRETSPLTLKYLGIGAIVATFFARIFYRNSINLGLPVIECPDTDKITADDVIEINLEEGIIRNVTAQQTYPCTKMPPHIMQLIEDGGLVEHLRRKLAS